MSIQRQTQIDNALEQLTKTERNNLLEKAKKESSLEVKPKIVEISSRILPSPGPSILGSSFPSSTPISVSGSFTNIPSTVPIVAPATTTPLITPINTTQSPITTIPEPTPINTTVQRDITVLETPAVPESAIVEYVGNKTPSQNTAQQAPTAESRPYLTAVNIPSSYSNPFSGLGQKLDTTLTDLNNSSKKYISRQMIADITQKRIDEAQKKAEIAQLNEPYKGAIILSPPKGKKPEEIANLLKEYTRNSLLQIAKDNGVAQKNSETKQNLLERLYQLDPTKILWNNYEKLKRQPKNK